MHSLPLVLPGKAQFNLVETQMPHLSNGITIIPPGRDILRVQYECVCVQSLTHVTPAEEVFDEH